MKSTLLSLLLICLINPALIARDIVASRVDIGLNLAALYSGVPELQGAYYLNRYVGCVASAGYLNKARRGGIKVGEGVVITDAKGAYFKIGVKGRFVDPGKKRPIPWVQVSYVYSQYDETGYYEEDLIPTPPDVKNLQGAAHGIVVGLGLDVPLVRRLDLRFGAQFGYYGRKEFFGLRGNTFQPGIGPEPGLFVLGFNYRLGNCAKRLPVSGGKEAK